MPQATALKVQPLELTVATSANGFGLWSATISFSHTLSESDTRSEFNLHHHWARIRRTARTAIIKEIADRDRKRYESQNHAERRIRSSLPNLAVIDQGMHSDNSWYSVTLAEKS